MDTPYLTRCEAAEYTRTPLATLETMATRGGGPPFLKRGRRVLYRKEDLDRWLWSSGLRMSTSDPGRNGNGNHDGGEK